MAAVAGRGREPTDRRAQKGTPTEAIVLVADRRLTDSGDNSVRESWVMKIRGMIGTGATAPAGTPGARTTWSALYAGDSSLIDTIKARVVADPRIKKLNEAANPPREEVASVVSDAMAKLYEEAYRRAYDAYVYEPLGLTRDLVVRRDSALGDLPREIAQKIVERGLQFASDEDELFDYGCELLLCGFDEGARSAVLSLDPKGNVTRHFDTGFSAIGEGSITATAHMELLGYEPWMELGTVLYMALDAKLASERVASVGPATDAWVMRPRGPGALYVWPDLVKSLALVRAAERRKSPFYIARDDERIEEPPHDWRNRLWAFVQKCYAEWPEGLQMVEANPPKWYRDGDGFSA